MLYSDTKYKIKEKFLSYLHNGGFPETINIAPELKYKVIQSYIDLVLFRDVIERRHVSRPDILSNLVKYLTNNVAREFSIHGYYRLLKSQGIKIGKDLLYLFMDQLSDTYYFFFVEKYSPKNKTRLLTHKKVYVIDNGIFTFMSKKLTKDLGWLYENLVFITLKRRGYDVYYYKNNCECDFIGLKGDTILPVQVSLDITNEREKTGLLAAMKELKVEEGYIINEDTAREEHIEGKTIRYIPLWQWLLS